MKTVTTVQENCGDIYADAKVINEEREAAQAEFEGQAEEYDRSNRRDSGRSN